jgi:hypothetical protein
LRFSLTTRVITYTYECATSLKQSERDKLYRLTGASCRSAGLAVGSSGESFAYDAANRLGYFYEGSIVTDLDWDANPLRCEDFAPWFHFGDFAATCEPRAPTCILGTPPTAW